MSSQRRPLVLSLVAAALISLLAATPARAQSLFITTTTEDTGANQLALKGGTFALGARVFLALTELTVVSTTPTEIVASLGTASTGSHWLIVYQPSTGQIAQFWATIGVAPPAPTQGLGARVHYTGNGWLLESVSPNLFLLRSTTNGAPRALGLVFPQNCGGTTVGFGDMTTNFMLSTTAGDGVFGGVCNPGANLLATVWDTETSTLTQIRCVRTSINANMCQRFD